MKPSSSASVSDVEERMNRLRTSTEPMEEGVSTWSGAIGICITI